MPPERDGQDGEQEAAAYTRCQICQLDDLLNAHRPRKCLQCLIPSDFAEADAESLHCPVSKAVRGQRCVPTPSNVVHVAADIRLAPMSQRSQVKAT